MHVVVVALFAITSLLLIGCKDERQNFSLDHAWYCAASYLVNDATKIFRKLNSTDQGNLREERLGLAITLLDTQPKIASNLYEARQILENLIAENNSDQIGVFARYVLGRYYLLHSPEQNLEKAIEILNALFEEKPDLKISQLAFATSAMISLSPQITSDENFSSKVTHLEELAKKLHFPEAKTMFHLCIAYAANQRGLEPRKVVEHLIEAQKLGVMDFRRQADSHVLAGNMALKLGDLETAIDQFSRFVKNYPRDVRNYTVRQMLEQIQNQSSSEIQENGS